MININELNRKLKAAQEEIKEFQKNCKHEKQAMKMNDKNEIKWHCIKCDMFTKLPTKDEVTKWLK